MSKCLKTKIFYMYNQNLKNHARMSKPILPWKNPYDVIKEERKPLKKSICESEWRSFHGIISYDI